MSTIDPGMEDPVKDASHDIEDEASDAARDRDEDDQDDLMYPSTWWFASTACPLLAGTFGPIASGFNICALVYNWRVYIPPNGTENDGDKIEDPHWLVAVNAVSLAFALIGNATLLLNMARRVKFSTAQPITISGFLLGGIMLIADLAAINASPTYYITQPLAIPDQSHALTAAYYYAIWAAAIYMIIGLLMCITVYGAEKGLYDKDFKLTAAQRTLMLQTMLFMAYLLLGALVFSHIEGWEYLDAVYWADVTLLTVGLGDFYPTTHTGRGLLFPFAIGGVLIVGLVIGSIRSLVLERGKEKMSARITEKRRESAIQNVDVRHQTIRVSWFAKADFITDPRLSPGQRREQEFAVMRKVQKTAERERRYFALFISSSFALVLWFVGAAVFRACEEQQHWTYFESLYFSFVVLMTIGYGDITPVSNSGRAFFVVWSLLAVPSLTILISNMGDTIVKGFSDITVLVGSITVLPSEKGFRASFGEFVKHVSEMLSQSQFTPPGLFGDSPKHALGDDRLRMDSAEHESRLMAHILQKHGKHVEQWELDMAKSAQVGQDETQREMHFYHYVLVRELRIVQKDLSTCPSKQYSWADWEYYLHLIGNKNSSEEFRGQTQPDMLVPRPLRAPESVECSNRAETVVPTAENSARTSTESRNIRSSSARPRASTVPSKDNLPENTSQQDGRSHSNEQRSDQHKLDSWSWLSDKSPLMGSKPEAEWILEHLSAALERELDRQRKGYRKKPPISMEDALRHQKDQQDAGSVHSSKQGKAVQTG